MQQSHMAVNVSLEGNVTAVDNDNATGSPDNIRHGIVMVPIPSLKLAVNN
jgi:hypothetical protein